MSNQIEKSYINSYRAGLAQAFQQTTSKFRPYVDETRQAAEFDFYDRLGIAEPMQEVTTRFGANPIMDVPHDRRRIGLRDFDWGRPVDPKDLIRVATDPTSSYMSAGLAAVNRQIDDIIIPGFTAPVFTGKKGEVTVTFVGTTSEKITVGAISNTEGRIATAGRYQLTAGNVEGIDVAQNFVFTGTATASGITLDKLKAVRETMQKLEACDQDTVLDCWITSAQARELLGIPEVINSDYAVKKALAEGAVTSFMGFRFLQSERLLKVGSNREVLVTRPQSLKLAISEEITGDMWKLTGNKNIPYMYLKLGLGVTRMWGECTARVNCLES